MINIYNARLKSGIIINIFNYLLFASLAFLFLLTSCSAPADTSTTESLNESTQVEAISGIGDSPPESYDFYPELDLIDWTGGEVDIVLSGISYDLSKVDYVMLNPVTENGITRCEPEEPTNLPYWEFIYNESSGEIKGMSETRNCTPGMGEGRDFYERIFIAIDRLAIGTNLLDNYSVEFGGSTGRFIVTDGKLALNPYAGETTFHIEARISGVRTYFGRYTHGHELTFDLDGMDKITDENLEYVHAYPVPLELTAEEIAYAEAMGHVPATTKCQTEEGTDLTIWDIVYDPVHGLIMGAAQTTSCSPGISTADYIPQAHLYLAIDMNKFWREETRYTGISIGGEDGKYLVYNDEFILNPYAKTTEPVYDYDLNKLDYVVLNPVTENGVTRCEPESPTDLPYWEFIYQPDDTTYGAPGEIYGMVENDNCEPLIGIYYGAEPGRAFLAIDRLAVGDDLIADLSVEFGGATGLFIFKDGKLALNPHARVTDYQIAFHLSGGKTYFGVYTHAHELDFKNIEIVKETTVPYVRVNAVTENGVTTCVPEEDTSLPIREVLYDTAHGVLGNGFNLNDTCIPRTSLGGYKPYGNIFLAIDADTLRETLWQDRIEIGGERGKYLWKENSLVLNPYVEPVPEPDPDVSVSGAKTRLNQN